MNAVTTLAQIVLWSFAAGVIVGLVAGICFGIHLAYRRAEKHSQIHREQKK